MKDLLITVLVIVLIVLSIFFAARWLEAQIFWSSSNGAVSCQVIGFRVDKLDIKIRFFDWCPIYKPNNINR